MGENEYNIDHSTDEAIIEKYCKDVCILQGLKTYLLNPEMFDSFLANTDLSEKIRRQFTENYVSWIKFLIELYPDIFPALVFLQKAKVCQWLRLECLYRDGVYYHVHVSDSWMCLDCRTFQPGIFIMPFQEFDQTIYSFDKENTSDLNIPSCFQKIICKNCGKIIHNHFLILNHDT